MSDPCAPTPLATPAYFISDAHLGAVQGREGAAQLRAILEFLAALSSRAKSLVIVGDLFDFWYEWRRVIPKQHFAVLHALRYLTENQVAVHYLAGNHDFRLNGFLETEIGLLVHQDEFTSSLNGERTFIFHGDGILARDSGYRFVKSILRNRTAQRVFSWLHPDLGILLARGTSITSRKTIKERPEDDADYLAFARRQFAAGFRYVIMGHTHRPIEHNEAGCTYVNLGDWIRHFTYALHDGESLKLQKWDALPPS